MLLATCFISVLPWTWNNNGTDVEEISMGTMCDKATLCGFTCDEMDNVVMFRRCAWTDVSLLAIKAIALPVVYARLWTC